MLLEEKEIQALERATNSMALTISLKESAMWWQAMITLPGELITELKEDLIRWMVFIIMSMGTTMMYPG